MILWLRPQYILALITSLFFCSSLVFGKTYEKFLCATEEGQHQLSCPDEKALITDLSIRKVYRRTETCEPDEHSEYLAHCETIIDGSVCEGNQTCSIEISSRDYVQCGNKFYLPTYFFIRYTCTQIHTMCVDREPIRNTLYGYIVSPAYPDPMADQLKCSINIEADSSMFIEISPIEISLQDTMKCRSDYLEIFGYDSSTIDDRPNNWKSYYTWCGNNQQSTHHPTARGRYLISSNSLYISLQTGESKKSRSFKIRYKIVPSKVHSSHKPAGITAVSKDREGFSTIAHSDSSTTVVSITSTFSSLNSTDQQDSSEITRKRIFKKHILIVLIAVGIVLLLILVAIIGFLLFFLRRRRSSKNVSKKSSSNLSTNNNVTTKGTLLKSPDKAPLLEQTANNNNNNGGKRKLVPERTVQIADVKGSRFNSNESGAIPTVKTPLTAADSGIYGADLTEEKVSPIKSQVLPTTNELTKIESVEIKSNLSSSEQKVDVSSVEIPPEATTMKDTEQASTVEQEDQTIKSAYPSLIDATTSENEANFGFSTNENSRRPSIQTPLLTVAEQTASTTDVDARGSINFNPLHVILKKDANKYYTTEYI